MNSIQPAPARNSAASSLGKDWVFAAPRKRVDDFDFGEKPAEDFDDMPQRSVPMYTERRRAIGALASAWAVLFVGYLAARMLMKKGVLRDNLAPESPASARLQP